MFYKTVFYYFKLRKKVMFSVKSKSWLKEVFILNETCEEKYCE